jgi:hypothetical protein
MTQLFDEAQQRVAREPRGTASRSASRVGIPALRPGMHVNVERQ